MSSAVSAAIPTLPDEVESARKAGLRYRIPSGPGIQREKHGEGFTYISASGHTVTDEATLKRIQSLVIPPAWTSVWISPDPSGHIQAVGRDARGRKQYRYHPEYRAVRDLIKFDRMKAFGKVLPRIRRVVARDLNRKGLTKRKVLAAIVSLLEGTFIRIGNEEYVEENGSFGLTTLRNRHLQIIGDLLKFRFSGKSAQKHEITIKDARLARILRKCKDLPGSSLFEYLDEAGKPQTIDSGEVNDYIREVSGGDFTAKDFRTWGGTCLATQYLLEQCTPEQLAAKAKATLVDVVKSVASKLGNKPATCRKYYIHPIVSECYALGVLERFAEQARDSRGKYVYDQVVLSLVACRRDRLGALRLPRVRKIG